MRTSVSAPDGMIHTAVPTRTPGDPVPAGSAVTMRRVPEAPVDPVAAWAAADGTFPAVIEDGAVTSRAEMNAEINRVASGLAALGVRAGERGVWCGPNSTQVVVFMHACRKLGLVAVPLPYRFTAEECHHVLADSEAAVVMVDTAYAPTIAGLRPRLPALRHAVAFRGPAPAGFLSWDDVTVLASRADPPPPADYVTDVS